MKPGITEKYRVGFLIAAGVLWGTSFPGVALGLRYIGAELLLFTRFFLATVIAFILFPRVIKKSITHFHLALLGILNGLAYYLQFFGQQWVPPGLSSLLINAYAILVPFTAHFLVRESITRKKITAAMIGMLGVGLVSYQDRGDVTVPALLYYGGVVIVFTAGVIWALYVTLAKKMQLQVMNRQQYETNEDDDLNLQLFVASLFYSMVVALITVIIRFLVIRQPETLVVEGVAAAAYLAVLCTVIPFLLYFSSLQYMDVGLTTIILLLEVAVSYFISILYFKETLGLLQVIGVIFIMIGVWMAISESTDE